MTGFWGRRAPARITGEDAELARRADAALIAADERVRLATDELAFAEAELGGEVTAPLREVLAAVRHHLGEAFALNQLNHDHIPDRWEKRHHLSLHVNQARHDQDRDRLDNRGGRGPGRAGPG